MVGLKNVFLEEKEKDHYFIKEMRRHYFEVPRPRKPGIAVKLHLEQGLVRHFLTFDDEILIS